MTRKSHKNIHRARVTKAKKSQHVIPLPSRHFDKELFKEIEDKVIVDIEDAELIMKNAGYE